MSVHKKLMEARVRFNSMNIKKSGKNTFVNYGYFDLKDFIIPVQQIFHDVGLCGVVSFTPEMASLTITDIEDGKEIVITSPMSKAELKAVHPVQNVGAVETYQRRYLWMAALEIVEHDALEQTTGTIKGRAEQLQEVTQAILDKFQKDDHWGAYEEYCHAIKEEDDKLTIFELLKPYPAIRRTINELSREEAKKQAKLEEAKKQAKLKETV